MADEVRKTHKELFHHMGPLGGKYSLWKKGNQVVGIHDDDDEIVMIFDSGTNQFVYLDEKTKKGMEIIGIL